MVNISSKLHPHRQTSHKPPNLKKQSSF